MDINALNALDIISLVLMLILGIKGFARGFIKEISSIIGIVGGVWIASRYGQEVGEFLNQYIRIDSPQTLKTVGFVIALILVWIVVLVLGSLISNTLNFAGLGFVDKTLGFIFGVTKLFLIISIIFYSFATVEFAKDKLKDQIKGSQIYPIYYNTGAYVLNKIDFNKLKTQIQKSFEQAKQYVQ